MKRFRVAAAEARRSDAAARARWQPGDELPDVVLFEGTPAYGKANEARRAAEEAVKNAKSEIDLAKAQSELAVMAAQLAALRKYRQKR
jgi:hypothetical protein